MTKQAIEYAGIHRCDASIGKHDAQCTAHARITVETRYGSLIHYCSSHAKRAHQERYTTQPPRSITKTGTFTLARADGAS